MTTNQASIRDSVARDAAAKLGDLNRDAAAKATITDGDLTLPDSKIALAALDLTRSASEPVLFNHCLRTYLFGLALGRRDGLTLDKEVFFLGAVMHDLGFTEAYSSEQDFERAGARAARDFLLGQCYDDAKADTIFDAIDLHIQAAAFQREPEVALVRMGAGVDVVGMRHDEFSPEAVERALAEYPRLKFKACFSAMVSDEIQRKPEGHIARLMDGKLPAIIRAAPFAE